ncbi:MAG: helix-turn-helix domain-containing protein [Clostridia bacterium]|nr:helix-turn-helix domain-containing protein [Clostridia bacterium]
MYKSFQDTKKTVNYISITSGRMIEKVTELHTHDFDEIAIILKGSAIQHINDEKYLTSAGDVFLINSYDYHCFHDTENLTVFNIGFKKEVLDMYKNLLTPMAGYQGFFVLEPKYRKQNTFNNRLHLNSKEMAELEVILENLEKEYNERRSGQEIMITSYFLQIIGFLCRKYENHSESKTSFISPLSNVISYIEKNYTEHISLNDLAKIANTTVSTLITFFKKTFGQTPTEYIISLRLTNACELLRNSDDSITYISGICGFNDINYFSRIFKNKIGMSPREYRKKYSGII